MKSKNILDWFNPHNIEHMNAYLVLGDTGAWPVGFIPEDTIFPVNWHIGIIAKLADEWTKYFLK